MEIEDRFVAATPEGVSLEFVLAGLGSRFVAALLDGLVQSAVALILAYAVARALGTSPGGTTTTRAYVDVGLVSLITFLAVFGYPVLFECLNNGRTPGKAMTGLRVVRTDGAAVGFRSSLLRNVLRLVDWLPAFYFVGSVLVLASRHNQRLGDMLGSTLVVRERGAATRAVAGLPWNDAAQWGGAPAAWGPPPAPPWGAPPGTVPGPGPGGTGGWGPGAVWLPPELAHWDVTRVGDQEMAVVNRFLSARGGYTPEARSRLAADLATRLGPLVAGVGGPMDPERFLEGLSMVKAMRR
ncbi:MAG TPA: RDD family protein [Acidimicrobiales bacterium]|nr:RDD family protein [Acidimicrobiales bacterium]